MATDKKGGGLDDLKSRLGLDSVLSKSRASDIKPAAPPPAPVVAPPAGASAAQPAPPAAAPVPQGPLIDFGATPPIYEQSDEGEEEAARDGAYETGLASPVSKTTRIVLIAAGVLLLVLSLAAGFGFGKGMRERQVYNETINSAESVRGQLAPVIERLQGIQAGLAQAGNDYTPELHALFTDNFTRSPPLVTTATLVDGRILLTASEAISEKLIAFSTATQILLALAREHMAKTNADLALIEQLVAGGQVAPNYAVVFDSDQLIRNYRAFFCTISPTSQTCPEPVENAPPPPAPNDAGYIPTPGAVVTYQTLEITMQGEAENQSAVYSVMWGGQERQIEIYNLLTIGADDLVTNPNEETALDRYRARVVSIRNYLNTVLQMQTELMQLLDEQAAKESQFTI